MTSRKTRIYVGVLWMFAAPVSVVALIEVDRRIDVLWFALLVLWVEQLKSRVGGNVLVSLTSIVATASYPVLGMWGAPFLLSGLLVKTPGTPLIRRIYNTSQNVLCTFIGGVVYEALGGSVGAASEDAFPYILVPFTAANIVWHLANIVLVSGVLRIDTGVGLIKVVRPMFAEATVASTAYSYLGLVLAVLWLGQLGPAAGVLMLTPLLIARWATAQWTAEQKAHAATLRALAQAIETKDLYTRGHGERVSRGARLLGVEMGWDGDRLEALAQAGLLHDVGKIGVPTRVLRKDGRLTETEYAAIKLHPLHGIEVVGEIAFLEDAREGILHHHERVDGMGYPSGLRGDDIPVFARVLAIADAFDCMTTIRSYRAARPVEEALAELIACRASQFDAGLVDLFVGAIRREGWSPGPVQPLPAEAGTAGYDHDDPTHPPQVEDSRGGTG